MNIKANKFIFLFIITCHFAYSQDFDIEKFNNEMTKKDSKGRFGNLSNYYINIFYSDEAEKIKYILPDKNDIKKIIKKQIPDLKEVPYLQANSCSLLFYYHINKTNEYKNEFYGDIYLECLRDSKIADTQYEDALSVFWAINTFIYFYISDDDMTNSIKNNLESLIKDFAIKFYQGK